jgi:hypothetical protein
MPYRFRSVFILFFLLIATKARATLYTEPSWRDMLDNSDLVALVEYETEGSFQAKAKVLKVFKGDLVLGDHVWVSEWSKSFGSKSNMNVGQIDLIFAKHSDWQEGRQSFWYQELASTLYRNEFLQALNTQKVFFLWAPTAGKYSVRQQEIQLNLYLTHIDPNLIYIPLPEVESFLEAYYTKMKRSDFGFKLLAWLEKMAGEDREVSSQELMMLDFLEVNVPNDILGHYSQSSHCFTRLAVARLAGNLNEELAVPILMRLLHDENEMVKNEALNELLQFRTEAISNELLSILDKYKPSASKNCLQKGYFPNPENAFYFQLIRSMGEIGYKPSIPKLYSLLETTNPSEFATVMETLEQLGAKDYSSYINSHLKANHENMIDVLCNYISKDSLIQCVPFLMEYIQTHDRMRAFSGRPAISRFSGLARFNLDTVKDFIKRDFNSVLKMPDTNHTSHFAKEDWLVEYLHSMGALNMVDAKVQAYNCMYDHFGFNYSFRENPSLLLRKHNIEDSLRTMVFRILAPEYPDVKVDALAFLDEKLKLGNYMVQYLITETESRRLPIHILDSLNQQIHQITSIDLDRITGFLGVSSSSKNAISLASRSNQMDAFLFYLASTGDVQDIAFLNQLLQVHPFSDEFYRTKIESIIRTLTSRLDKN